MENLFDLNRFARPKRFVWRIEHGYFRFGCYRIHIMLPGNSNTYGNYTVG